jgi:hypothetical protein
MKMMNYNQPVGDIAALSEGERELLRRINLPRLRLAIAAMRSGLYAKGAGYLHRRDKGWCCLGILTDVAIKFGLELSREWVINGSQSERFGGHDTQMLCAEARQWYGLSAPEPLLPSPSGTWHGAAAWNDGGPRDGTMAPEPDFTTIADGFEKLAALAEQVQDS